MSFIYFCSRVDHRFPVCSVLVVLTWSKHNWSKHIQRTPIALQLDIYCKVFILLPLCRQLFSLWVMNTWLRQMASCEHNLDEHHHLSLCNNTKQCGREILVEAFLLCWIMLTQKRKSMNINVQCYYEVFVFLAVLLTMLFVSFNKIVVPDICGHC